MAINVENLDIDIYASDDIGEVKIYGDDILGDVHFLLAKGEKGDKGDGEDYLQLLNKPKINNVELGANSSLSDLGIASASDLSALQTMVAPMPKPKGTLPSGTDLNNVYAANDSGAYFVTSGYTYSNMPSGITFGILEVFRAIISQDYCVCQRFTSNDGYATRYRSSSGWSDWRVSLWKDNTYTYNGLTLRFRRTGNTCTLFVSGAPTSDLATNGAQVTLLSNLPAYYRPAYGYVNIIWLGSAFKGQLNVLVTGAVNIGYVTTVATGSGKNITTSDKVYAKITYEV